MEKVKLRVSHLNFKSKKRKNRQNTQYKTIRKSSVLRIVALKISGRAFLQNRFRHYLRNLFNFVHFCVFSDVQNYACF